MTAQQIPFTKMHGLGNDYIYINGFEHTIKNPEAFSRHVSDRHFGIGGDGLVLIEPSTIADARMRMFNADGSESEMCGNALRCVGAFLYTRGIARTSTLRIETLGGMKELTLSLDAQGTVTSIKASMGQAEFSPTKIPCLVNGDNALHIPLSSALKGTAYEHDFADFGELTLHAVATGNPHVVCIVPSITDRHVHKLGPVLEHSPLLPQRANIEFVEVRDRYSVRMRVWERGSGETMACGTGAVATVAVAHALNLTDSNVTVTLNGGDLEIFAEEDKQWYMSGPATFVFDGVITFPARR